MGRIVETTINRWDGGIATDPRDSRENTCQMVSNFDVTTNPKKMTPYRSTESGDSAGNESNKQNFFIGLRTATTFSLYALGVVSGTSRAEILYKNLTQGSATDLDDNVWATPTGGSAIYQQPVGGETDFELFVYYERTVKGYFKRSNSTEQIWSFDPTFGVAMAAETGAAFNVSVIGQGLVHSADDILYIPYALATSGGVSAIARNNNGTWTAQALLLPRTFFPTSICEYGNYLAIACAPRSGIGNSRVFLWDRVSTSWNESIDWGDGQLTILEIVDGELIGISQIGGSNTSFSVGEGGTINSATNVQKRLNDRIIFRRYIGGNTAIKFHELIADHSSVAGTTQLPIGKQVVNNRLHFLMLFELNGAVRDGVWSVGKNKAGEYTLVLERPTTSAALALTTGILRNFIIVGDFCFISYQSGGVNVLSKTDDTATYTTASIYESKRFNAGDASKRKDLIGVTVTTEYLPAAGQVILAYRVDQNTAWTTIFTNTTDNSISNSVNSASGLLPRDYKEIEFRIESTGGAEITGLSFQEEIKETRVY